MNNDKELREKIEQILQLKHLLEIKLKILRYKLKYKEDPEKDD